VIHTRNLPGFCHAKAGAYDEWSITIFCKVFESLVERNSSTADDRFATTVDTLEGREVKLAEEVLAVPEVAHEFGQQEVGRKREFDRLSSNFRASQTRYTMDHEPFLRSSEGISEDRRG
jgi:hypothetical protein